MLDSGIVTATRFAAITEKAEVEEVILWKEVRHQREGDTLFCSRWHTFSIANFSPLSLGFLTSRHHLAITVSARRRGLVQADSMTGRGPRRGALFHRKSRWRFVVRMASSADLAARPGSLQVSKMPSFDDFFKLISMLLFYRAILWIKVIRAIVFPVCETILYSNILIWDQTIFQSKNELFYVVPYLF